MLHALVITLHVHIMMMIPINRNHHGGEKRVHQGRTTSSSDQGLIQTLDDQWFNLLPLY